MAIKWVNLIIAPILVLAFVGMLGLLIYRCLSYDYFDYDGVLSIGLLFVGLCGAYIACCLWGSLFAMLIYGGRHLACEVQRSSKATKSRGNNTVHTELRAARLMRSMAFAAAR